MSTNRQSQKSLQSAVGRFLDRHPTTQILGLGEPTHGDDTFLCLRNDLFLHLAQQRSFSAIALETEAEAAKALDDYVTGLTDDVDRALNDGFIHGFGSFPGNRDLLMRLRGFNARRPPGQEKVRCLGIDAPMELSADDYDSPSHAERRLAARTASMVQHLDEILAGTTGSVMVFAHNSHLQRTRSSMQLGRHRVEWESTGSMIARRPGARFATILSSCSAAPARGVPPAPLGTVEQRLDTLGTDPILVEMEQLAALMREGGPLEPRADLTPAMAVAPLDPGTVLRSTDAVLHVPMGERGPVMTPEDLRRAIGSLPDVVVDVAGSETGAPEVAWGDTFFTVRPADGGDPARMPFATLVESDHPGFDESSALDRVGVYALDLNVGPRYFEGLMGFPPRETAGHLHRFDPRRPGTLMPHPQYAAQGWLRILNPPAAQRNQLLGLAAAAADRSHPRGTGPASA